MLPTRLADEEYFRSFHAAANHARTVARVAQASVPIVWVGELWLVRIPVGCANGATVRRDSRVAIAVGRAREDEIDFDTDSDVVDSYEVDGDEVDGDESEGYSAEELFDDADDWQCSEETGWFYDDGAEEGYDDVEE